MRQTLLSCFLMATCTAPWAQEQADVPNPPSIPTAEERAAAERAAQERRESAGQSGASVIPTGVPQERETAYGDTTVTEYSRGGQVYSVKVKQKHGPTQYLDVQEDGELQNHTPNELPDNPNLPKWRIGNW